jgi:hypothetical protein
MERSVATSTNVFKFTEGISELVLGNGSSQGMPGLFSYSDFGSDGKGSSELYTLTDDGTKEAWFDSYNSAHNNGNAPISFLELYATDYNDSSENKLTWSLTNTNFSETLVKDFTVTLFSRLPYAPDGTTPYVENTAIVHTSGNLKEVKNNGTDVVTETWDGVVNAVGGFGSTATDAAVTIASTGWTNTFGKNAVVYLDGIGLTFKVYNNAGTPVYTNSVALAGDSVLLQPSGKIIITGGTLGVGRATPF